MRTALGWSQQRLADESGVNKATINQVEQGKRSPSIATLESLARAMGAEVADFFPRVQPDLFTAAERNAGYADRGADTPQLTLASMFEANQQDRERVLEAASASALAAYLDEIDAAMSSAERAIEEAEDEPLPEPPPNPTPRVALIRYAHRLGMLRREAEFARQPARAGVA